MVIARRKIPDSISLSNILKLTTNIAFSLNSSNVEWRRQLRQSTADALDGLPDLSGSPMECNTTLMHIHTLTSACDVIWGYASEWKEGTVESTQMQTQELDSHQDVDCVWIYVVVRGYVCMDNGEIVSYDLCPAK